MNAAFKRESAIVLAVAGLAVVGMAAHALVREFNRRGGAIPTSTVQQGDITPRIIAQGALEPGQTAALVAPAVFGGTLRITQLAKSGSRISANQIAIEFSSSEQEYNLEQSRFELQEIDQEIDKARAEAQVQAAVDQAALQKARFDVRRAELETCENELVSAMEAKRNLLMLDEARRVLEQLESDAKSHTVSSQAGLTVVQERRQKALLAMQDAQQNIESMTVRAPIDGLVEIKRNDKLAANLFVTGVPLPEYREGDQAYPGAEIAQVVAPSNMEVRVQVTESDRAGIRAGQEAIIVIDALPARTFHGKVKDIASLTSRGQWGHAAARSMFDLAVELDQPDVALRPGFSAQVTITGNTLRNVLSLPAQAIFERDNGFVVYVKHGNEFRMQSVEITYRTESRVVVEGLHQGTEVALTNPETQGRVNSAAAQTTTTIRPEGGM